MRCIYIWAITSLLSISMFTARAQAQLNLGVTTLDIDTVITGLNVPWEILYGPDGKLWMTEREGIISRVDIASGNKEVLLDIQNVVYASGEAGMLGMVLHPNFPQTPYLYVTYTFGNSGTIRERMVRYTFDVDTLISPTIYLDSLPGFNTHIGCRMVIGPDNKIYMTTGDVQDQPSAQDVNAITGKVLRLELDGSVPTNNPIPGSYIYSWGHRNAQGLAFGPTGILYSSEHGPNTDDELNIIEEARNYGWPTVVGYCNTTAELSFCADSNVREPLLAWTPTIATSDLIYYDHPAIPEWQGTLLMTVLKNKQLKQLSLNTAGDIITSDITYLSNQFGRLRDIVAGPDGTIYIATNGANWGNTDPGTHSIIRLKNNAYQQPLMVTLADTVFVCEDSSSLNPNISGGSGNFQYSWSPSTGLSSNTSANPTIYSGNTGVYYLTVTDTNNNSSTDSTLVVNGIQETFNTVNTQVVFTDTFLSFNGLFRFHISILDSGYEQIEITWRDQNNAPIYPPVTYNDTSIIVDGRNLICVIGPCCNCFLTFELCVIDKDNCTKTCTEQYFQAGTATSVGETKLSNIQLYPNPTKDKLYVQNIEEDIRLSIIDLQGKTMLHKELNAYTNQNIDLSELASGMYLVKMVSGNGERTTKLLVD